MLTQAVQPCSHNRVHTGSTTVFTQAVHRAHTDGTPCSHRRYNRAHTTVFSQAVHRARTDGTTVLTQTVQPCSHTRAHTDGTTVLTQTVQPCSHRRYNRAHTDVPIVLNPGHDNVASVLSRSVGFVLHYWTRQLAIKPISFSFVYPPPPPPGLWVVCVCVYEIQR